MTKNYTATVRRSGEWWAIDIEGLPFGHTQAKRLDQVEATARELISMLTEVEEDAFGLDVHVELEGEINELVIAAQAAREAATQADTKARAVTAKTVRGLSRLGLPQRDVGRLLGITYQRVQQIAAVKQTVKSERAASSWATVKAPNVPAATEAIKDTGGPAKSTVPGRTRRRASA